MRSLLIRKCVILPFLVVVCTAVTTVSRNGAAALRSRILVNPAGTTKSSAVIETVAAMPAGNAGTTRRGAAAASGGVVNRGLVQALAGAAVFAAIEKAAKHGLQAANIKYPAQLGACILLFAVLSVTDAVAPVAAHRVFTALTPGAALLAKWFPVLFVPALILLPLSPPIGGSVDVSIV